MKNQTRRCPGMRIALLSSVVVLCISAQAAPGQAARPPRPLQAKGIYATDLWVGVDKPSGPYQRVHLYGHSVSLFSCSATVNTAPTGGRVTALEGLLTMSDKDGTLVMNGVLPRTQRPGRYWIIALCSYPIEGNGREPTARYTVSFVLPRKVPRITPPPALRAWVSPASPSYQAQMTLYAKTDPGALCSAYFQEANGWVSGDPGRAGKQGIVSWNWIFQDDGTAFVICDNRAEYARAQVDY